MTIRTQLTIAEVLSWADAFYERTGEWPSKGSGKVWEPPDEKWINIDMALRLGLRGFHRGQSLARLLAKHRGKRNRKALPKYTIAQILKWADSHHARVGEWPKVKSGAIADAPGETWAAAEEALRSGQRGLRGGSSLAQLLEKKRRVPNPAIRPCLTLSHILRWADSHFARTGSWPIAPSGPIVESQGDTWAAVDLALRNGRRGLSRSSLFRVLVKHRGIRNHRRLPRLTVRQILAWCDDYHARTGKWPHSLAGPIRNTDGETWLKVDRALRLGARGLLGGMGLAGFLGKERGVRNWASLPALSEQKIIAWARAFRRKWGRWPERAAGLIPKSGGETWGSVHMALYRGGRGLPRRTTLSQLLANHA